VTAGAAGAGTTGVVGNVLRAGLGAGAGLAAAGALPFVTVVVAGATGIGVSAPGVAAGGLKKDELVGNCVPDAPAGAEKNEGAGGGIAGAGVAESVVPARASSSRSSASRRLAAVKSPRCRA